MSKANLEVESVDKSLVVRALEGLGVGLVLTNAQGRVTWLNRAAQRVIGLDAETSRGRPLQSLLQDPKLAEFWRGASTADEVVTAEVPVAVPRSSRLKANAATAHDPHGQLVGRALLFCEMPSAAERPAERPLPAATPEGLTPQEMKVLRLVGDGLSNRQIAEKMQVAPSTVRSHLKHLYSKLGLRSRSEAVSYALRNIASLPQ
ncbi:MAG TPA: LuxR C-terminal-related transcriptional regulator [Planctomycetota bacterium]|nr:LuxR C-terminal-related transcriptional regulator [Planctomycetota bacterium]